MARVKVTEGLRKFISRELMITLLIGLLAGLSVGYMIAPKASYIDPRYKLASQAEIDAAKKEITAVYQGNNAYTGACVEGEGYPLKAHEWQPTFEKYLKVNRYANRAVIRDCHGSDTLLRKVASGKWMPTTVNVILDFRANPLWQVECLADDLLKPDDTVRPENDTIDGFNFLECAQYREEELITQLLRESASKNGVEFEMKSVKEYIEGFRQTRNR